MAFYAFMSEPPEPRTRFETKEETKTEAVAPSSFEQAMVNVLVRYPEAYRAVVDEMRRLDGLPAEKWSP